LNQAEIEIGIFSRQCLGKRKIPDLKTLRQEAKAWNRRRNRESVKIAWKSDRQTARRKFQACPLRRRSHTCVSNGDGLRSLKADLDMRLPTVESRLQPSSSG
jgi:hypothetical protein